MTQMTQEPGHSQVTIGKHNTTLTAAQQTLLKHSKFMGTLCRKTESHFASVKYPNLQISHTRRMDWE